MSDRAKSSPKARRNERLSAALRENLKRRKAQVKGRQATGAADDQRPGPHDSAPHDSAGFPEDKDAAKPR
jgi:hypothetical protein